MADKKKKTELTEFDKQVNKLPRSSQSQVHKKVFLARKYGWTDFELWDWGMDGMKLHHMDLVGIDSVGDFNFVPPPEDMDSMEERRD